jgi:carboxyl-terminal processing protease
LERFHYDKRFVIDVAFAQRVLERFVSTLDPNRSFFLQGDVDEFIAHPESLAAAIKRGELNPYFRIFHHFNDRVNQRLKKAVAILDQDFDFSVQETYRFDRSKAPWANSKAELDEIWRKRIKSDYLSLLLLDLDPETVTRKLRRRYQRTSEIISGASDSDVAQITLNAFAQSVDENTRYIGPTMPGTPSMGIGLDLSESNGLVVIQNVVPGGPADRNGLAPGNVILAVGQGPDGEMKDVVGSYLSDVVDKINGPRDTLVRLRVTRHRSGPSGPSREVGIVRVETPLEGQVARAFIIDDLEDAPGMLIGVVAFPAFYRDFKAESEGNRDFHSSARDLEEILTEFKQAGVAGVLLDLRGNGGGSFLEAVAVAGLFIESGPIAQVKDSFGKLEKELDPDPSIAFAGPLAVLVDHKSAAASEIVAAAIQDYQRGIVVGERTFGRGSIQTLIDLNRFVPGSTEDIGRLLLTMAMFFRPVGDGVQLRGVEPDVVFPTDTEGLLREQDRADPMPWGRVDPIQVSAYGFTMKPEVLTRHLARVGKDRVFQLSIDLIRLFKLEDAVTTVSLNESQRRADKSRLGQEVAALLGSFSDQGEISEDVTLADVLSMAGLREAAMVLSDCIRTGCFRE